MIRLFRRTAAIMSIFELLKTISMLHALPAAADDNAYVRVIHASPDIGIVDVFVDGKKLLSNFQFATITDYVPIPAGTHTIQLALIGKDLSGTGAAVTQSISVQAGVPYTVAALGTKQSGFSFSVFTDDNTIANNAAKVRVYHLSPGTGSAQIQAQSNIIVRDISYPGASSYVSLASGSYAFQLNADAGREVISSDVALKPWTVTSIFAIGVPKGNPKLQIVTSQQQGIPGMPYTGNDPDPALATSATLPASTLTYWPFVLLFAVIAGISIGGIWYRKKVHTRATAMYGSEEG